MLKMSAAGNKKPSILKLLALCLMVVISIAVFLEAKAENDIKKRKASGTNLDLDASGYEQANAEPYSFKYNVKSRGGASMHEESGDTSGRVTGFYMLMGDDGRMRRVDYMADETGFHASIKTNEIGTRGESSADALYLVEPPTNQQLDQAKSTPEEYEFQEHQHYLARAKHEVKETPKSHSNSAASQVATSSTETPERIDWDWRQGPTAVVMAAPEGSPSVLRSNKSRRAQTESLNTLKVTQPTDTEIPKWQLARMGVAVSQPASILRQQLDTQFMQQARQLLSQDYPRQDQAETSNSKPVVSQALGESRKQIGLEQELSSVSSLAPILEEQQEQVSMVAEENQSTVQSDLELTDGTTTTVTPESQSTEDSKRLETTTQPSTTEIPVEVTTAKVTPSTTLAPSTTSTTTTTTTTTTRRPEETKSSMKMNGRPLEPTRDMRFPPMERIRPTTPRSEPISPISPVTQRPTAEIKQPRGKTSDHRPHKTGFVSMIMRMSTTQPAITEVPTPTESPSSTTSTEKDIELSSTSEISPTFKTTTTTAQPKTSWIEYGQKTRSSTMRSIIESVSQSPKKLTMSKVSRPKDSEAKKDKFWISTPKTTDQLSSDEDSPVKYVDGKQRPSIDARSISTFGQRLSRRI